MPSSKVAWAPCWDSSPAQALQDGDDAFYDLKFQIWSRLARAHAWDTITSQAISARPRTLPRRPLRSVRARSRRVLAR